MRGGRGLHFAPQIRHRCDRVEWQRLLGRGAERQRMQQDRRRRVRPRQSMPAPYRATTSAAAAREPQHRPRQRVAEPPRKLHSTTPPAIAGTANSNSAGARGTMRAEHPGGHGQHQHAEQSRFTPSIQAPARGSQRPAELPTTSSGAPMPRLIANSAAAPRSTSPVWPMTISAATSTGADAGGDDQCRQHAHDGDAAEVAAPLAVTGLCHASLDESPASARV